MTRAVRDIILKDSNCNISDHLRNHIHLTNCIHLKNHMHKHSPILADRALVKDLIVLQRSRSLRDPSASPHSWHSTSVIDLLSKRIDNDIMIREGRRSLGSDLHREGRRFSGSSPAVACQSSSKVAPGEEVVDINGTTAISDHHRKIGGRRKVKRGGDEGLPLDQEGNELEYEFVSRNSERKAEKAKPKGKHSQDSHIKTLSEQLNEVTMDSDGVACSHFKYHGRRDKTNEQHETRIRGSGSGLNRAKRCKFRSARKNRAVVVSKHTGAQNEMSVASNSVAPGAVCSKYHFKEGKDEYDDQILRDPKSGCGIPWNWSRIHHRGKTFLDMAGRSLSCGLSDPRLKKGEGEAPIVCDVLNKHGLSDYSTSSTKSKIEAFPLLVVEPSVSPRSAENAAWAHDYSGELGIFADNLLKHGIDSDLASEARSGDQRMPREHNHHVRHQNMTQKYMPRTFRDLVGQNFVAQALSNAVVKKKVGLLYVFYGPHGTGKTSCARIFARALNCQSLEEPKPCSMCNSCIAHDTGKNRNIREYGTVCNFGFESIVGLVDNMVASQLSTHYKVCIFDDCETLTPDRWSAISKVIDEVPRRVVFVLVSSSLDVFPHIVISRCQKFFFPKLKDSDIIHSLQWIASKEDLEIDKDALKLIASRSDGSLRDAEMTLEQLSLLGQRISVPLVQELAGLISDDKLVDLLDLALSADTVNTVKNLREIMENGVEPLALMSQIATVITDILAGSYDFTKERQRRKFFRRQPLRKEDMEKLRKALKTLSEAEKQLRMSNDKLTWLTAALLQLAPDLQYMLPTSSADTSFNHSPLVPNNGVGQLLRRGIVEHAEIQRGFQPNLKVDNLHTGTSVGACDNDRVQDSSRKEIQKIWLQVLEKIQFNSIREFMYQEGKLISISFGAGPIIQLMFSSLLAKSKAEKFSGYILQSFESVLGSPVAIEITYDSRKDVRTRSHIPLILQPSREIVTQMGTFNSTLGRSDKQGLGSSYAEASTSERIKVGEQQPSKSLVRSKVSLAHVIQQTEGCAQRSGWSNHKAVSIAEKLEQENLRLEARSRSFLCWKASRVTHHKLSRLRIKTIRSHSLLMLVPCGKCVSTKSPR